MLHKALSVLVQNTSLVLQPCLDEGHRQQHLASDIHLISKQVTTLANHITTPMIRIDVLAVEDPTRLMFLAFRPKSRC
jgi:RecB family endonuclease NucS